MRCCRFCNLLKKDEDFALRKDRVSGRKSRCKECISAYQRAKRALVPYEQRTEKNQKSYAANPESKRNESRRSREKYPFRYLKAYGISIEEFDEMMLAQGGECEICRTEFNRTPHVDHDHKTGKFRGLLCGRCNRGIGMLKDSAVVVRRAADYLERVV